MKARDRTRRFFTHRLGGVFNGKARKVPRWVWLLAGVWLAWATVLSDHSFWRIAQLKREIAQAERETRELKKSTETLEAQLQDPYERRFRAEEIARTDHGWAAPGEIVYRFRGTEPAVDTTQ